MSQEAIVAAFAFLFSLALFYIPSAESGWAKLSGDYKRLVILGGCLLIVIGSMGLACLGVEAVSGAVCPVGVDSQFWFNQLGLVLGAAGVAQVTYGAVEMVGK